MARCYDVPFTDIKDFQSFLHRMVQEHEIAMAQEQHLSFLQNFLNMFESKQSCILTSSYNLWFSLTSHISFYI